MNISFFLHEGGPVLWAILAGGLAAIIVFLDRSIQLHRDRIAYGDFLAGVFNILEKGNVREAVALCDETPGPVAVLVRTAITHRAEPRDALLQILENTGRVELARMERRLSALNLIVHGAPLLGLLGALLGVLETVLYIRGNAGPVQTIDITGGLICALVNSIAGLAVAIPAFAMSNILSVRIDRLVLDMEQASNDILAFLSRWNARYSVEGGR